MPVCVRGLVPAVSDGRVQVKVLQVGKGDVSEVVKLVQGRRSRPGQQGVGVAVQLVVQRGGGVGEGVGVVRRGRGVVSA